MHSTGNAFISWPQSTIFFTKGQLPSCQALTTENMLHMTNSLFAWMSTMKQIILIIFPSLSFATELSEPTFVVQIPLIMKLFVCILTVYAPLIFLVFTIFGFMVPCADLSEVVLHAFSTIVPKSGTFIASPHIQVVVNRAGQMPDEQLSTVPIHNFSVDTSTYF